VNLLISVFEAPSASKVASGIAVKSKSVRSERDRVLGWHGRRHRIAACLSCEMPRGAANGPRPSEVGDQSGRARKRRAFVEQRGSALLDAQPIVVRRAACLRHSRRPVLQRNGPTRRNLAAASAGQLPTSSSARSHVRWPWLLWLGRAGGPTAGWELLLHPVLCDFWLRVCVTPAPLSVVASLSLCRSASCQWYAPSPAPACRTATPVRSGPGPSLSGSPEVTVSCLQSRCVRAV